MYDTTELLKLYEKQRVLSDLIEDNKLELAGINHAITKEANKLTLENVKTQLAGTSFGNILSSLFGGEKKEEKDN